jgi:dienelactone hydrolase
VGGTEDRARAFVESLAAGAYAECVKTFDDVMAEKLPEPALKMLWEQLLAKNGAFASIRRVSVERVGKLEKAHVIVGFAQREMDVSVVYAGERVSGLWIHAAWTAAPYADASRFETESIVVGGTKLPGALTKPVGVSPAPAIVLVHGSGPCDADETTGAVKPFRDLAEGLASKGIAVVRYDKRTRVHPELFPPTKPYTIEDETIADVRAAVAMLRERADIDRSRIFVLGHSLGGYIAPRIATEERSLAGIAILAGAARPIEELLVEQMKYIAALPEIPAARAQAMLAFGEASRRAVQDPALEPTDVVDFAGSKTSGAYWLDLRDYRPAEIAASLTLPICVLQGARDYQVVDADWALWSASLGAKPNATLKKYEALDHLFVAGAGPSTPADYERPGGHVAAEVIADLARWLASV